MPTALVVLADIVAVFIVVIIVSMVYALVAPMAILPPRTVKPALTGALRLLPMAGPGPAVMARPAPKAAAEAEGARFQLADLAATAPLLLSGTPKSKVNVIAMNAVQYYGLQDVHSILNSCNSKKAKLS